MSKRIIVVGGGPAGVRAAETLVAHGVKPLLIDEAARIGGQIYRQPPDGFKRSPAELYGWEAGKATALYKSFENIRSGIDHRPNTLAWNVYDGQLYTVREDEIENHPFDALILATGATDRVLPINGWTKPGVFTLGGAQIALKYQGCAIGRKTVFIGGSPLLYLVAYQYAKAGGSVAAVLDTAPFANKRGALPALMREAATLAKGLHYMTSLRLRGIPLHNGVAPVSIDGEANVRAVTCTTSDGRSVTIDCDSVAMGFGLKPETQLADLAGCDFVFDETTRQWTIKTDRMGRAREGIYIAGDGGAIRGADAAECGGRLAALSLLNDLGLANTNASEREKLAARLDRYSDFQAALAGAFSPPPDLAKSLPDETIVCRCEAITAGELRSEVERTMGPSEVNRAKALSRVGMGRCQGRFCGQGAAEIIAARTGADLASAGRLRTQAPVKPLVIH